MWWFGQCEYGPMVPEIDSIYQKEIHNGEHCVWIPRDNEMISPLEVLII